MLRAALFAIVPVFLVACTVETTDPSKSSSSTATGEGTNKETEGASKPEVRFSCSGAILEQGLGLDLSVGPRCIGGGPNVDCGSPSAACAAQDVVFSYPPPASDCDMGQQLFFWDGSACKGQKIVGSEGNLACKGNDCKNVYKTADACAEAHSACPR